MLLFFGLHCGIDFPLERDFALPGLLGKNIIASCVMALYRTFTIFFFLCPCIPVGFGFSLLTVTEVIFPESATAGMILLSWPFPSGKAKVECKS